MKQQAIEVEHDAKVVECKEMYDNFVKGFKFSQKFLTQLVEQLVHMKVGSSLYFQPLRVSKLAPSFHCVKSLTIEACPIYNEDFDFNDICITSYGHAYHPQCLLVHTVSSRKCKATNCEAFFHDSWCSSFELSKIVAKVTEVEGSRTEGSP